MIRNLNQLNFKGYGTVSQERPADTGTPAAEGRQKLTLFQGDAPIYRAGSDTWLFSGQGMTVLSVSKDGGDFLHFYLDKPVYVAKNVCFCLSPFRQRTSSVELSAEIPPEATGSKQKINDFQIAHRLWVTDLYTFFYHEKERGFFFPGEAHPMAELTYVDRGSLHSVVDGVDTLLQQGELAVYGPNQWHMQYADMEVAPRYVTISFDAEGCDLAALLNRKFTVSQTAATLLQALLQEQERMDAYSGDMILARLSQLLLTILRQADSQAAPKLQPSNAIHNENEIIRRAQQYISAHVRERLTVPLVASRASISPSYLTALFHKHLQISPGEYIRRIKLQESKQMIREGNLNFTEIAATLQYSTVHHFSRQFKDKFGITPTEYAKSVR